MNFKSSVVAGISVAGLALFGLAACSGESSTNTTETVISDDSENSEKGDDAGDDVPGSSSGTEEQAGPQSKILIDDFEDGDAESAIGSKWYSYDDKGNDGNSSIEFSISSEGYDSKHALSAKYTLDKGDYAYEPYVAIALSVPSTLDFSKIEGFSYCYKGGAHRFRVETSDIKDYNVHGISVKASSQWTCPVVKFKDIAQEDWGDKKEFNKEHINQISVHIKGSKTEVITNQISIDNITFLSAESLPADKEDMTANDPVIPKVDVGDVTISNPLQAMAMKYLNKGVNFTNWLEEANSKFDGKFKFGEKDVKVLAGHGFKSIRLPIDLDLYVTNRTEFLSGKEAELKVDTKSLFEVLDAFEKWTKENGMSLVIDYHEYDNSYNKTSAGNKEYVSMMANVWKTVAEHYSANEREDLFYELLNEPDMSSGEVSSTQWTKDASALIDSIRAVDANHAIVFGDARWYSIDSLVINKALPFKDDKVIYAVHNYEPFMFTHQSASWTDYASIKNIPFPYNKETWSTYSSYYGVNLSTLNYVVSNIKTYYKVGSKESIKQLMYKAKKWAVEKNVPVILNEFGAYNGGSDEQSRMNYYKAIGEICKELEIPWQHWGYTGGFAVVDSKGELIKGMAEAFDLGK